MVLLFRVYGVLGCQKSEKLQKKDIKFTTLKTWKLYVYHDRKSEEIKHVIVNLNWT